jgi:hypothetical protein
LPLVLPLVWPENAVLNGMNGTAACFAVGFKILAPSAIKKAAVLLRRLPEYYSEKTIAYVL